MIARGCDLQQSERVAVLEALRRAKSSLVPDLITTSPAVTEGENFMSYVIRVDVTASDMDTGERLDMCMVLKRLPESEERRVLFHCYSAFTSEAVFYCNILPVLERQYTPLPFAPCWAATPEYILLKHLGQNGFVMPSRKTGLNLDHCLLVIQELARFHATSYAAKFSDPIAFSNAKSTMKEWLISEENSILNSIIDNSILMSLKVGYNPSSPTVQKVQAVLGRGYEVLSSHIVPCEPLSVVVHGDLWNNNLLFKYPQRSQSPSQVCFLDLQVSRYASPALDIVYFLLTSSSSGVLKQHFHHLISEYHKELSKHLATLAPQSLSVTLDDVKGEVQKHAVFGLLIALLVLPVVTMENNNFDVNDMTEQVLQSSEFREVAQEHFLSSEYKRRVIDMFDLCDREGF